MPGTDSFFPSQEPELQAARMSPTDGCAHGGPVLSNSSRTCALPPGLGAGLTHMLGTSRNETVPKLDAESLDITET